MAASDYIRSHADQIRAYVPQTYRVLGTDGFGRSDTRKELRKFFEVDRHQVALAALTGLVEEGRLAAEMLREAIAKYDINPKKPNPVGV